MMGKIIVGIVVVLLLARIAWRLAHRKGSDQAAELASTKPLRPLTPWQRKLFTVYVFARLNTRRYFRDKTAIFFTVAFPLIFLCVFGGIFGSPSRATFKVALINQSHAPVATNFAQSLEHNKTFKIDSTITTLNAATDKMTHGSLDGTIILPANFGETKPGQSYPSGQVRVYYTQNGAQAAGTLVSVLQGQLQALGGHFVKTITPFSVASTESTRKGLTQFDYTFSGLLGFAILGLGVFGPVNVFPELKKQGILRRFHTTPLRTWQYFLATMISQALIGLMTMAIMFAVAMSWFHLKVVGNYLALAVYLALSIVLILGIGLAIGGWAKNERQAAPLGNIATFPMMFLSGTFFPRYVMPEWLQHVTNYLPLTPVIDGVRLIATEGKSLLDLGSQLAVMAVWLIVVYALAFRVFRWE